MKIGIIGGAGVRTPLLVHGLAGSDLPLDEIALYDSDLERLERIGSLARTRAGGIRVSLCRSSTDCIRNAAFVFTSIRVGGIERRARDEAAILALGVVGQETVGAGGFAMAMRTIPAMNTYAEEVAALAPHAWVINFTNPVGIITQAVLQQTRAKIIGICDTPTELYEEVAHALGLPSAACHFDYFGLNHLGWLREVYHNGEPRLERLWSISGGPGRVYRASLFDDGFLRDLGLLPTEYLYYYYRTRDALENIRRSGTSRGEVIQELNERLFAELGRPGSDAVRLYEDYLNQRNTSYMRIESGATQAHAGSPWASLTGYDKIALAVVRAIHFNTGAIIPLNVRNHGNVPILADNDVVEVPCAVNANGAIPLHVGEVPEKVRDLLTRVKHYERLTIQAALTRDRAAAREALAANPLVDDRDLADRLLTRLELP